jgi:hypothetical protein
MPSSIKDPCYLCSIGVGCVNHIGFTISNDHLI